MLTLLRRCAKTAPFFLELKDFTKKYYFNFTEGITLMSQLDNLLHRKNKHMLLLKKTVNANTGQVEETRYKTSYTALHLKIYTFVAA